MGKWLRRLAYLLRQSRHERELREEIEAHRALRAAYLDREGLAPQQAEEASRRAIGNVLLAREDVREVWLGLLPMWWQDVRYALRAFRKNAAFTAVAVVTLALGIGVNTGIFTVLNGVLLRDLPAPHAHELVSIAQTVEREQVATTSGFSTVSMSEYRTYRERVRTLSGVLAHSDPRETTLGGEAPQEVFGAIVSCNYFSVLQQPPSLGRGLAAQDCDRGAPPVVVLGHAAWTTVERPVRREPRRSHRARWRSAAGLRRVARGRRDGRPTDHTRRCDGHTPLRLTTTPGFGRFCDSRLESRR